MPETVTHSALDVQRFAGSLLQLSAVCWFIPVVIGQWFFAYHVAEAYFAPAYAGNLAAWNERLFVGLVKGDTVGNTALSAHLLIAFVITVCGTLQLVPQIRTHTPAFHRWNGRIYIVIAFVSSIAGTYMHWTRDTFGPEILEWVNVLNGLLIMLFAMLTFRYAVVGNISTHSRWALRTFMVVSGVWYLRVIYAFLDAVPGDTPGAADDMSGPANIVIGLASYLLPLAVLEFYFFAQRTSNAITKHLCAILIGALSVAMSIGVYGTTLRWLS
jgi:uncharacterized membrane protein